MSAIALDEDHASRPASGGKDQLRHKEPHIGFAGGGIDERDIAFRTESAHDSLDLAEDSGQFLCFLSIFLAQACLGGADVEPVQALVQPCQRENCLAPCCAGQLLCSHAAAATRVKIEAAKNQGWDGEDGYGKNISNKMMEESGGVVARGRDEQQGEQGCGESGQGKNEKCQKRANGVLLYQLYTSPKRRASTHLFEEDYERHVNQQDAGKESGEHE
jgi:hypothetical protein